MSLVIHFPTTVNALRPHQTPLESTKNKKMGCYPSLMLTGLREALSGLRTHFLGRGIILHPELAKIAKIGPNKYTNPSLVCYTNQHAGKL